MLQVRYSSQFRKDPLRLEKQGKDMDKVREAILCLVQNKDIPAIYYDHSLRGPWNKYREIHLEGDWLLVYVRTEEEIILVSTGSHSDLFDR